MTKPTKAQVRRAHEKKQPTLLTASQRSDLADAIRLVRGGKTAKLPEITITSMPGFAPMQMRALIDKTATARREIEVVSAQFEDTLRKLKGLEDEEKAGLAALKKAAAELREKGSYCAQAETAILQFTAKPTRKPPGIEQMIAKPDDKKWENKAGDLFGRISAQLGEEVADAVQVLYDQCKEDLVHVTTAIGALKIVNKVSSLPAPVVKEAGIADVVVGIKEWFAGKVNPIVRKIMDFTGDITRWVKGFVERGRIAKKANDDIKGKLAAAAKFFESVTEA